ncbi:MAG TPA: bifunctional DNA-formamidopyrimidine glycosylase/DNA-(apurinic or apyrimidinic site) lyase [Pyrinomonadaceae bacterium]|nr:bifunctional DNA-formamidopyrimidine glycosylase/DNA-(apurinic or apyrimidinic site) lyase [Pyrinomonadaceae bacterium]
MPELPEVELVAKSLNKLVSTKKIVAAELLRKKLAPSTKPNEFSVKLKDSTINFVHRRGKHILFDLNSQQTLLTHLRMTGRFMLLPLDRELPKHSHAIFYLDDETRLIFQDQRHFGLMKIIETKKLFETKELIDLAPEPFSEEFNLDYLKRVLSQSKRPLKEFLLDQTKVCGLGNIYVSETLFISKINPQILANEVPVRKIPKLFNAIKDVLAESIAHGSTLNVNPENIDGSYYGGDYEDHWRVYDQEGNPCPNCQTKISRIVQAGRSTFFCPNCQKK